MKMGSPLAYIGSSVLSDRRSGLLVIMMMVYVVEVAVDWLNEAWDSRKLWRLPQAIFGSFREPYLRFCFRDEGLSDVSPFLAVLDCVRWTQMPLLQSHYFGCDEIRTQSRASSHKDFV